MSVSGGECAQSTSQMLSRLPALSILQCHSFVSEGSHPLEKNLKVCVAEEGVHWRNQSPKTNLSHDVVDVDPETRTFVWEI